MIKDKLINFIVSSVLNHRKKILLITALLSILSILSLFFLLRLDLSFMGIAGQNTKEVKNLNKIMENFNVSGTTTVVLQPLKEKEDYAYKLLKESTDILHKALDWENKDKTIQSILSTETNLKSIGNREKIFIAIEILNILGEEERFKILNSVTKLNQNDKKTILKNITNNKIIYRKLQKLDQKDINIILSEILKMNRENQDKILLSILNYLSIKDKQHIIEIIDLSETIRNNISNSLTKIEGKINQILEEFKLQSHKIAEKIKADLIPDINDKNNIIDEVMYFDGFSFSKDKLMFMIIISASKNIDNIINSMNFSSTIDKELDKLKNDNNFKEIIIRRTGYALIQRDQENSLLNNFWLLSLITLIGIFVIFWFGLRRIAYPIMSMVPLLIGILIMFGLSTVILRGINLLSLMSPILLFGLGIDYAIHFGSRYGEVRGELGDKASQEAVLKETYRSIGTGLMMSSITTIFAFLSLLSSKIGGFLSFGLMSAIGIITIFLCMTTLLPIYITYREKKYNNLMFVFLNPKKFPKLGKLSNSKYAYIIFVLIGILALYSIIAIPNIETETDALLLKPEGIESVELALELEERYEYSDMQTYFIIDGYENLINFEKEINRKTENDYQIYKTINTSMILSARTPIKTLETLGWNRKLETLPEYKEKFSRMLNIFGDMKNIGNYYEYIIKNFSNIEQDKYLVMVPPSGYIWNTEFLDLHIQELSEIETKLGIEGAGMVKVWKFILGRMINDLAISSIVALVIVLVVLAIATRSVRGTLICFLSLLISVVSTLSIMSIIGMKFNVVNVVAFPLIIGLGIDYSIHIFYRIVYEEKGNIVNAISSTGKAVFLTTLTTLIAFASFLLSIHPGFKDFGVLVSIGIFLSFVSSLFVIPCLVKLFYRSKKEN